MLTVKTTECANKMQSLVVILQLSEETMKELRLKTTIYERNVISKKAVTPTFQFNLGIPSSV